MQPTLTLTLPALPLRVIPERPLDDGDLFELCALNPSLRIERSADGALEILAPTGGDAGRRNAGITAKLWLWNEQRGLGVVFDSSTGFVLPNGAERSPDAAWVARDRWEALTEDEKRRFPPLCPDLVVEVRSPSDRLETLHEKLREYIANGARLGWLVDPDEEVVWVYHPGGGVERHDAPARLSGGDVLPGLEVDTAIWW